MRMKTDFYVSDNPQITEYYLLAFVNEKKVMLSESFIRVKQLPRRLDRMKKEYDMKKLKKRPGKVKVDPEAAKIPISIRLDGSVLSELKSEADRLGIPYQTHIGSVLHRFTNGDLVDLKSTDVAEILKKTGTSP